MDSKTAEVSPSQKWQAHCQQLPQAFLPIRGTAAARKQAERWEARFVDELFSADLPLEIKAVALRSIMELRGCTARDAERFFRVDPRVVVAALSLLELPCGLAPHEVKSRTQAA